MIINDLFNNKKQGIAEGWKTGATLGGLAGGLAGGPAGAVVGAGAGAIAGQLMKKKDPKTIPGYSENLTDATSYVLDHLPKTSYGELVMSARPQEMDKFDAIILNDLIPEFFIKKYGEEKGSYYLDKNPKLAKALYSEIQGLIRWIIPITITSKKFRDYKHNEVSAELGDDPKYLKYFGISQYDDWEDKQGMAEGWGGTGMVLGGIAGIVTALGAGEAGMMSSGAATAYMLLTSALGAWVGSHIKDANDQAVDAQIQYNAKPGFLVFVNGKQISTSKVDYKAAAQQIANMAEKEHDPNTFYTIYDTSADKIVWRFKITDNDVDEVDENVNQSVTEVRLGDYRKKAQLSQAMAQTNRFFDRDNPTKVATADQTIAKRERGLARADARAKPYTPPAQDAEKMQRDLTAKYPNIDELVAAAEQRRDPNYDRAEGNAYYDGREAEQNYQKLKQIQRVIQGLNESQAPFKKNYLYEGLDRSSLQTVKLWESAGQRIMEAELTVDQINQLFKSAEQDATAAGGNRTMIGKGKDAAMEVNKAWEELKTKVATSGPIKNMDAAYDVAADKLKQATGGDQGVMKYVQKYRDFAKKYPVAQSLIYSALIAAAGISGAGLGGAAALGLFKLVDKLLQGDKFSSAAYAGAKTGAMAYGASKVADYFKGPKAPEGGGSSGLMDITGSQASQAQRAMYQAIEADPSLAKNAGALADIYYDKLADLNPNVDLDYLRSVADSAGMKLAAGVGDTATSAATNAAGDLARMAPRAAMKAATDQATQMINSGQITDYNSALAASDKIANALSGQVSGQTQEMIRSYVRDQLVATGQNGGWVQSAAQTAAQAASQNSGQLASQAINNFESREFHTSHKLTEADLYFIFSATTQLNEGIWDSIKGTASKYAGKAADWAKTQGTNLTTKVTADKLKSAWLKADSPTDSDQVYNVMIQAGVAPQILDTVYKTMDIPTFKEKALSRPTTPSFSSAPIPAPKSTAPVAPAPATTTPSSTAATPNSSTPATAAAPAAATGSKTKELGTGTGRINPATGRPWTPSELKAKYAQPQPTAPTPNSEPPGPEPEPMEPKNSSDPFKAKRDAAALAAQQAMGDVASPAPAPTVASTSAPAPATTTPSGPPGFNAGNLAQLPGMSQSMQPKPAAPKPAANYGPGPAGYKSSNFSVGPTAARAKSAAAAATGKTPAELQQDYYRALGLAENLSWSKNFDPGRSLYRQIRQDR